jgi:hypothetical protein
MSCGRRLVEPTSAQIGVQLRCVSHTNSTGRPSVASLESDSGLGRGAASEKSGSAVKPLDASEKSDPFSLSATLTCL